MKTTKNRPPLRVVLQCPGNPDFGQYAPIAPDLRLEANDIGELISAIESHKSAYNLGGGNFRCSLYRGKRRVARVSYNGRIWPPGEWVSGMKDLTTEEIAAL